MAAGQNGTKAIEEPNGCTAKGKAGRRGSINGGCIEQNAVCVRWGGGHLQGNVPDEMAGSIEGKREGGREGREGRRLGLSATL